MTNNRKIELAKKAYELQKKETKKEIVQKNIIAACSFASTWMCFLVHTEESLTAILRIMGILFAMLMVVSATSAILNSLRLKLFAEQVNSHEFEIVKKEFDEVPWYCIYFPDTDEYFRAEIVEEV